jgi:hypothetical protein
MSDKKNYEVALLPLHRRGPGGGLKHKLDYENAIIIYGIYITTGINQL